MVLDTSTCDIRAAKTAAANLFYNVSRSHDLFFPPPPSCQKGPEYENPALNHAIFANQLENSFALEVYKVASEIASISGGDRWVEKKEILSCWADVALAITYFSEHQLKKVGALIIDDECRLQAFAANRIPKGIPFRREENYNEGEREYFIVCSEKNAFGSLLEIEVKWPENKGQPEYESLLKTEIQNFSKDILTAGQNGSRLKNSFILTTASPCMSCAEIIAHFGLKGVITADRIDNRFKRATDMTEARNFLKNQEIPIISLPCPTLV